MQIVAAVIDPLQLGFARAAMLGIRVSGPTAPVADALVAMDEVIYVVVTAGSIDIVAEVVAKSDADLLTVSDQIRRIPGVQSTETFVYLQTRKEVYNWGLPRPGEDVRQVAVEPGRERPQVLEHDVRARVVQLLLRAAAGEDRDAHRVGRERTLDVVDVVADIDARALAVQHVGLADAPDLALEVVDVEPDVVDVEPRVRRELAGHDHHPAAVPPHGRDRLVRAGHRDDALDRVVGVERPETVDGGLDRLLGQVRPEEQVQRWAEVGGHLVDRELDTELAAQRVEHLAEAGHGVDEGHVEVEADDQWGISCHSRARAGRACAARGHGVRCRPGAPSRGA